MRTTMAWAALVLTVAPVGAGAPARRLSRAALEDKIRGGWAGQMIGVSYGAPTEFRWLGRTIEDEIPWSPEKVENAIQQDDLYVEMTFAEVMDRVGLEATTEQYGDMFRDSKYNLWHANAGARRNLNRGIKAPWSGHPKYNIHANDIDFQIESDFIGLMTPGLPREANKYCDRVGRVMNHGDGLYGGMFVAGMYAAAFFETDPRKVVEAGLRSIPAQSGYARVIQDLLGWHAGHPTDWRATWRLLRDKWDRDDPCPDGALAPFNIDARLNGAHVALGLLYGGGDFARTLEVATRAGQDSDCNPSSAAGVLGVILGYERIPERWKSGIPALAGRRFEYTSYSFDEITRSTVARALAVIAAAGGRVTDEAVFVPAQEPRAPPLEQWDPGVPRLRVDAGDAAWTFTGSWATVPAKGRGPAARQAETAGAEAVLRFEGTAVAVVGPHSQAGGRADVFLDGKPSGQIDAYVVERTWDNDLWHVSGLADGAHTVRIVTRGDADARSQGRQVTVQTAVVYGAAAAAPPARPVRFAPAPGSPHTVGRQPNDVAIADMNGDGRLDVIVAVAGSSEVSVLLGDGTGGLVRAPGTPRPIGMPPGLVAVGDLDRDGLLDVVVTSHDSHDVIVLRGDGRGGLGPAIGSPFRALQGAKAHTHGLALGDLDEDGWTDITTADDEAHVLGVLRADGRGGFAGGAPVRVGESPYPHALGDLDGDGHLDAMTPNTGSANVTVLLGDGRGGFRTAAGSPVPVAPRPYFVALGHLDGDRALDAVVTHDDIIRVTVLRGDGRGGFAPAPGSPLFAGRRSWKARLGDLDGDGRQDLVLGGGGRAVVLRGDGRGAFASVPGSPFALGRGAWSVALGDLDRDGRLDIVSADLEDGTVSVLLAR